MSNPCAYKKSTVLLADSNRNNLRNMRDCLNKTGRFEVLECAFDGQQALQLVKERKPDLLIIDLVMPTLDCFAVLEALEQTAIYKDMKVIVTSAIWIDFLLKKAQSLRVDYVLHKPYENEYFVRRVGEILLLQTEKAPILGGGVGTNARSIVTSHLKTLGITANVKGYRYLRDAVVMVESDFGLLCKLTTKVYVEIAKEYETSTQCVERAVRHAIESAWKRGDQTSLIRFLGYTNLENTKKPSNGELITILADKLNTALKCAK